MGMRPVAEMQFADFISCAWDHLVTVAAKQRWRAGTPVPIVRATAVGRRLLGRAVPLAEPGVVVRAHPGPEVRLPGDARGRQGPARHARSRIRTRSSSSSTSTSTGGSRARCPEERYTTPFGKARVHREGDDVSVITWGAMVYTADEAAQQLESDGVSVEILDLRTIMPWDKEAVLESVAQDVEGARPARGHAHRRLRRRDRRDDRRGGVRGPRRAGQADRRAGHAGAVLAAAREGVHPAGRRRRRRRCASSRSTRRGAVAT